jgi:hypothetical protein
MAAMPRAHGSSTALAIALLATAAWSCSSSHSPAKPDAHVDAATPKDDAPSIGDGSQASTEMPVRDAATEHDASDAASQSNGDAADTANDAGDANGVNLSTASGFCAAFRQVEATHWASCFGGDASDWFGWFDSYTACDRFDAFAAAGSVHYHADAAQACLAADDPHCETAEQGCFLQVLEGTLATNAPCTDDFQCAADAACWSPTELGYDACLASVCTPLPGKDQACVLSDFCPLVGLSCSNGVCREDATLNQPCGLGLPACGGGLICAASSSTCVARSDGGACGSDDDCVQTQYCAADSHCHARITVGNSCANAPTGCAAFTACDTGQCVRAGHIGELCAPIDDEGDLCIEGFCDFGGSQRCLAVRENGASCTSGSQCLSGGCQDGGCAACAN